MSKATTKILVFDTETTGVPPTMPGQNWTEKQQYDASLLQKEHLETSWSNNQLLDQWPSILQLSYIVYDLENPLDVKIFNKYIDIPDNIVISETSVAVHHITRETIANAPSENRATIEKALQEFLEDVKKSDIVVGHNVQFDRKMVVAELLRLSEQDHLPEIHDMMDETKFECTMIQSTPICNLKRKQEYMDKKTGKQKFFYKIKSPKLSEAYKHFFGYEPSGDALHDALIDVVVCLRVFCKYKYNLDVCGQNPNVTYYIKAISPQGYECPMSGGRRRMTRNRRTNKSRKTKTNKARKSRKTHRRRH
jgi:DNA polymerase III subunit epsilon